MNEDQSTSLLDRINQGLQRIVEGSSIGGNPGPPAGLPPSRPIRHSFMYSRYTTGLTHFELGQSETPYYASSDADVFSITHIYYGQGKIVAFFLSNGQRFSGPKKLITGVMLDPKLSTSVEHISHVMGRVLQRAKNWGGVTQAILCVPERGHGSFNQAVSSQLQLQLDLSDALEVLTYPEPQVPPPGYVPTLTLQAMKEPFDVSLAQVNLALYPSRIIQP